MECKPLRVYTDGRHHECLAPDISSVQEVNETNKRVYGRILSTFDRHAYLRYHPKMLSNNKTY
jgi:hypothetical protein